MKSTNLPSYSGCQKCRQADDRITLLVGRRVNGAFRHVHDETLDNGKERPVAVRQLGDEARGVVVERLDCLQLQVGKRSGSGADFGPWFRFGRSRITGNGTLALGGRREGCGRASKEDVRRKSYDPRSAKVEQDGLSEPWCRGGELVC
jgi:hypothetical protein